MRNGREVKQHTRCACGLETNIRNLKESKQDILNFEQTLTGFLFVLVATKTQDVISCGMMLVEGSLDTAVIVVHYSFRGASKCRKEDINGCLK